MKNAIIYTDENEIKALIADAVQSVIDAQIIRPKNYYSNTDVCKLLHIAPATLRKLRKDGLIEWDKVSGRVVFQQEYIQKMIDTKSVPTFKGLPK